MFYFYRMRFVIKKTGLWLAVFILIGCGPKTTDEIIIETRAGDIEVKLYPQQAPKTVAAFLANVEADLYKNSSFYRILSRDNQPMGANAAELIQGGIYKTAKSNAEVAGIPHEPTSLTGLSHTHGTISMARLEAGTASTEFFICIGDNPSFNAGGASGDSLGYAAFGKVTKGMDVVMKIYNKPEQNQEFNPTIGIKNIVRK